MDKKQPPDQVPFEVAFSMDHLEKGKALLAIVIPDDLTVLIGRVLVQWGAFEWRMDATIRAVLTGLEEEIAGWEHQNFRKRKRLFYDLMIEYATKMCPDEIPGVQQIFSDAGDLQWRRNTVVHGLIRTGKIEDGKSPTGYRATFIALGQNKGNPTEINLDEPTLTKLWHDIAHLGGLLITTFVKMGGTYGGEWPELIIEDKELLQGPLSGNFQSFPIPKTP